MKPNNTLHPTSAHDSEIRLDVPLWTRERGAPVHMDDAAMIQVRMYNGAPTIEGDAAYARWRDSS